MPIHNSKIKELNAYSLKTGKPPLSYDARQIADNTRHLLNWIGQKQIFTFAGPGPIERDFLHDDSPYIHINPDYDFDGDPYFAVITKSEEINSTHHQLGAVVIPWRYQSGSSISWQHVGESEETLWSSTGDSHNDIDTVRQWHQPNGRIRLYNGLSDPGVSSGGYAYHKLNYTGMMIAGLSIWTMPDRDLSEYWRLFDLAQFGVDRQIRGHVSGGRRGLGTLIGELHDLLYRSSRCLIQSGHPTGVCTSEATYVNLRGDSAPFRVVPMSPYYGATVSCTPSIVAGASGATAINPVYVKFESVGAGDSCEIEITSDTEAQYTDQGGLLCNRAGDLVNISIKGNTNAAVYVRTYSIWEDLGEP